MKLRWIQGKAEHIHGMGGKAKEFSKIEKRSCRRRGVSPPSFSGVWQQVEGYVRAGELGAGECGCWVLSAVLESASSALAVLCTCACVYVVCVAVSMCLLVRETKRQRDRFTNMWNRVFHRHASAFLNG